LIEGSESTYVLRYPGADHRSLGFVEVPAMQIFWDHTCAPRRIAMQQLLSAAYDI
jgi:hypothetical protein